MKKNYYKLYIIASIITFLINLILVIIELKTGTKAGHLYNFVELYPTYPVLLVSLIISFALFMAVLFLKKEKYELNTDNTLFPISYLCFMGLMVVIALLFNLKVVIINMHFMYYLSFIVFAYLLLSIYTLLSFNFKIEKKTSKKNTNKKKKK